MTPLLEVKDLAIHIKTDRGDLVAVEDVSFVLPRHGTLGIVGESGCGKSITCLALTRLSAPNIRIVKGEVRFEDKDLRALSHKAFHAMRRGGLSMIFQDSISGLNPLIKAGKQLEEAIEHLKLSKEERRNRGYELLKKVGLDDPEQIAGKYPHQLSGGQRQRVMIAMAVAASPKLLIADEPTTALDVTTQLQILGLLKDLQQKSGMGMILISHDVGVIREMCGEVMVMYGGQAVEAGPTREVLEDPRHPYTAGLIRSVAAASVKGEKLHTIPGSVAALEQRQGLAGCVFADRCEVRCPQADRKVPFLYMEDGRRVRCHRVKEGDRHGQ